MPLVHAPAAPAYAPPSAAPSADFVPAFTEARDAGAAARSLLAQLAADAPAQGYGAIVLFVAHTMDGAAVARAVQAQHRAAAVVGCTTAGEFGAGHTGEGGASAFGLPVGPVVRAASAFGELAGGAAAGVRRAVAALEARLGAPLRTLDPSRHVGVVLVDGLHGHEEEVNRALGNAAPLLSFVGGSAGDNLAFRETRVFDGAGQSAEGVVLLLLELARPHAVMKTCSFAPTAARFTITRADVAARTVYEVDGRPVLAAYAEALGTTPERLDAALFMKHPVGLMMDGEPWIRSPQQALFDGGLKFYCEIQEGMEVTVMRSTDLVADTAAAVRRAAASLGGPARGALLFNCILRRLELDAERSHARFLGAFAGIPAAGFHTYGESWLGHMNQTCAGILFG
jgi:hypothetical protein